MCGRYSLQNPKRAFEEFSVLERAPSLEPRYNIAPTQLVPVVRVTEAEHARHVDAIKWGLASRRGGRPVIMVPLESLGRGAFRTSFEGRRCILVADGFYEWETRGKTRVPHHIHRTDDAPLALAAIWQPGDPDTCAVITKPAVAPIVDIHDRMPATVSRSDYDRWLDPDFGDREALAELLSHDIGLDLVVTEVSPWVNAAAHDDPKCVEPAAEVTRPK
jgi:putative SOS response-associated peptidase YedK